MAEGEQSSSDMIASGIVGCFKAIWNVINMLWLTVLGAFEFIWYPVKEWSGWCLDGCDCFGFRKEAANRNLNLDPTYSTFDNEV